MGLPRAPEYVHAKIVCSPRALSLDLVNYGECISISLDFLADAGDSGQWPGHKEALNEVIEVARRTDHSAVTAILWLIAAAKGMRFASQSYNEDCDAFVDLLGLGIDPACAHLIGGVHTFLAGRGTAFDLEHVVYELLVLDTSHLPAWNKCAEAAEVRSKDWLEVIDETSTEHRKGVVKELSE